MTNQEIARIAHEVNRAYCETLGDYSQTAWVVCPVWQQAATVSRVADIRDGVVTTPRDTHTRWLAESKVSGWVYGAVENTEKKTHPFIMPYDDLPAEQQLRDSLFFSVATALLRLP